MGPEGSRYPDWCGDLLTAVVIAIAWVALKPRAISGPAGEQSLPGQSAVK